MSGKTYADEAVLTAHLDKLLSTATTPTQAESLYSDTTISTDNLLSGHLLANESISTLGLTPLPPLPRKPDTAPCDDILATSFTTIVKLARCAVANKNLREEAEASLRASTKRVEELTNRLGAAETRVKKKDLMIVSLQNTADDLVTKHRTQLKKLSMESSQLRSRLLHASHRENQLVMSAKKKEKEFGQLQSRVHALFKTSVPIEQRITRVGTRASPRGQDSLEADITELGEERVTTVEGENDVMRGLLQAVQEELDDLILSHADSGSAVSEEFDVPPAPGDEVMQLPMDVIGDDLQDSLERKFAILRKVLESGGQLEDLEVEDNENLVEECDEEETDLVGHAGEVASPDSAHHSVDVMSGNPETLVDDNEEHQETEPEGEASPIRATVDGTAQNIDAEPCVEDGDVSVTANTESESLPVQGGSANSMNFGAEDSPIDVISQSDTNPAGTSNEAETLPMESKAEDLEKTLDALNTLALTEPTGAPSVPVDSNL